MDVISIDTFLLSCRALGRGVEHRMLAELGRIAQQRGLAAVEARFVRSQRNRPALLFLESVGLAIPERTRRGAAVPVSGGVSRRRWNMSRRPGRVPQAGAPRD